jgi:N-acetylmuramoyl-L-alanine amidase
LYRYRKLIWSIFLTAALAISGGCGRTASQTAIPRPEPVSVVRSPEPSVSPASRQTESAVVEKRVISLKTPKTFMHEVGPLETVWRLSKMYDVRIEDIYSANHLKPGQPIQIGQKLIIPNAKMIRYIVPLYPNPRWKFIIIHHTATDVGNACLINRCHYDRGFWHGLGYHFLIDNGTMGKGDGQIEIAPRWIKQQEGAHCKAGGMNEKGIGVALVGNFDQELPTPNQLQSLTYLLKVLTSYYKIPYSNIVGHRDVEGASTDCPGKRFPWQIVRQYLAGNGG